MCPREEENGQKIFRNALLLFCISLNLMGDFKITHIIKKSHIFQNTEIQKKLVGAMPNIIFFGHSLKVLRFQRAQIFRKFQKWRQFCLRYDVYHF